MRADRLVSILLLLQAKRRVTARELSERLEVSERTILRDMEALSGSGIPVMAERGVGGGWSLLESYQTKLTGLTIAQIQALFLSNSATVMRDLGLQKDADAAFIRLQASLAPEVRLQAEMARQRILIDGRGWRDSSESIANLPIFLDAIWQDRQVQFGYQRDGCEPALRSVDPLGLVAKGSVWYLVANVEGEPRTYRVSRTREASILDTPGVRPPDFDLKAYWERSTVEFREKLPRYYASFRANPSIMRWIRYRGWRLEEQSKDGEAVLIRMRFDIEDEAVQFALSFGGDMEVVEPEVLRCRVVAGALAAIERNEQQALRAGR